MDGVEIAKRARALERLMAKRRRLLALVESLDRDIREARLFLRGLIDTPKAEISEGELT